MKTNWPRSFPKWSKHEPTDLRSSTKLKQDKYNRRETHLDPSELHWAKNITGQHVENQNLKESSKQPGVKATCKAAKLVLTTDLKKKKESIRW